MELKELLEKFNVEGFETFISNGHLSAVHKIEKAEFAFVKSGNEKGKVALVLYFNDEIPAGKKLPDNLFERFQ